MFSAYSASSPIAAGVLPWPSGRTTLIAKLELSLHESGVFQPTSGPVPPLQLDVSDDSGELYYASDFAPFKTACDVLVAGGAVRHRGRGRLVVGELQHGIDEHESLGPREGVCPRGDPLEPSVVSAWAAGELEQSRFQSAAPGCRLPWPTRPFRISYERRGVRLAGNFVGPFARALVTSGDGSRLFARLPLALDTICLAPEHGRVTVLYRGVYERNYPADVAEHLAIDLSPVAVFELGVAARWPRSELMETRDVPRAPWRPSLAPAPERQETAFITAPISSGPVLPFRSGPLEPPTVDVAEETRPLAREKAATLPFVRSAARVASSPGLTPADIESLRRKPPVDAGWNARDTSFVSAPRYTPSDGVPAHAPARMERELPPSSAPPSPPAALARVIENEMTAPAERAADLADEESRLREITQEIWKGERPIAEILAGYSLSDADWRALRRKQLRPA